MMRPKLSGTVAQLLGRIDVPEGSRRDPGASGLISPSTMTNMTTIVNLALDKS